MSDDIPSAWAGRLETATRQPTASPGLLAAVRVPGLTVLAHLDPGRIGERTALPGRISPRGAAAACLAWSPVFPLPATPCAARWPILT